MWYHTRIAWQTNVDAKLLHTFHYLLLQTLTLLIPVVGVGSAPPLKIVHKPPCLECRTSNKLVGLILRIAQLQQHITPNDICAYDVKTQIDAMQSHPVEFLFPTLPIPERHRIRQRTIIEIIAVLYVRSMTLHPLHKRKRSGQRSVHRVPCKVYAHTILQIPVYTRGNADVVVSTDKRVAILACNLKEITVGTHRFSHNLARRSLVNTFKQTLNRGSSKQLQCNKKHESNQ